MPKNIFPDTNAYPVVTSINFYQRGFDIIARHWHETQSLSTGVPGSVGFETYMVWRINIVMWTCSTIEAVANLEGVSWMGEEFYKDVVERLKISAKIRLIHALKCKRRLSRDDPTVKGVQELFDIRNHYVHPKTHSMNDNDTRSTTFEKLIGYAPDTLWSLVQSVYAMTKDPPQEADQD